MRFPNPANFLRREKKIDIDQALKKVESQLGTPNERRKDINKLIIETEKLFQSQKKIINEKDNENRKLVTELEEKKATIAAMEELLNKQPIPDLNISKISIQNQKASQELKNEIDRIQKEHLEAIKKNDDLTKKFNNNQIVELTKNYQEAKNQLEQEKSISSSRIKEIENEKINNEKLKNDYQESQNNLEKEREIIAALKNDLENERMVSKELRMEFDNQSDLLQKLRVEIEGINERKVMTTEVEELQKVRNINNELRSELDRHETSIKRLYNEIVEITNQYQDASEKLNKANEKITILESLLIDLDKEFGLPIIEMKLDKYGQ